MGFVIDGLAIIILDIEMIGKVLIQKPIPFIKGNRFVTAHVKRFLYLEDMLRNVTQSGFWNKRGGQRWIVLLTENGLVFPKRGSWKSETKDGQYSENNTDRNKQ